MNQYGRTMVFTNASPTTCTLFGYPGLQLVSAAGGPLKAPVRLGGGYVFTDSGPRLVTLRPGDGASFQFGGPVIAQGSGRLCPLTGAVRVIASKGAD